MPSQVALFWLNELFFFFFYFLCLTADFLYVMHLASLHSFTRNLFPKHEATQLSTILQTWSNWGLWKLAYIPGNSYCIPWSHLLSCHWLKVLQWARWSHDQWLNGLFVLLSSLTDDLLQCKINSWCWYISAWSQILYYFFFFPLTIPQPSRPFFFCDITLQSNSVLAISPTIKPSVYFITTFLLLVPRSGMEISVQIFSWSSGKLDLSQFSWENLLIRENLFSYQWNV